MSEPVAYPTPSVLPPAGWYPDNQSGYERWWDGQRWTDSVRPIAVQPALMPQQPALMPQQPVYPSGAMAAGMMGGTDQRTNSVEIAFAWVLTVLTLGYLLPWAIAASRGKSNSLAVALVNLLAGWTVVGWIVALVMACGAHQQRMAVVQMVNVPHHYPANQYPPRQP